MSDAATDAENFAETLDYEVSVIAFESVQARMKLAIDTGDLELIDEIQPNSQRRPRPFALLKRQNML